MKMCGIIYYKDFTDKAVNRRMIRHYMKQKSRGSEGFGFIGASRRKILTCRATKEKDIRLHLKRHPMTEILFHHRLPTSTSNTIGTTHPIAVSQPIYRHKYYLVHNGIIYNASEMKAKHEAMGITYLTTQLSKYRNYYGGFEEQYEFNDSEALAHEVALFLDGKQDSMEAQGDAAFICLETDRGNNALKLHFARNRGSPLEMRRDSSSLVIASENVCNMNIQPHMLHTYDYHSQKITYSEIELPEFTFCDYSTEPYWEETAEIEMMIEDYADRLLEIEQAQLKASRREDFPSYGKLQQEKNQIEEQIKELYDEWLHLKE